jgi:benzodiazapine receptor
MAMDTDRRQIWRTGLGLAIFLLLTTGVGWLAAQVTWPALGWYAELNKPRFTPPDRVFGPVWSVLYLLMALAGWRVWKAKLNRAQIGPALAMFFVQLALNALWSPVFFGAKRPDVAFLVILMLLGALGVTSMQFFRVDRVAGWMLAPYLVWVAYAAALNAAIVLLNRI